MADHPSSSTNAQEIPKSVSRRVLTIEFQKPGTIPPVFIAGSFTAWTPVEMATRPSQSPLSEANNPVQFYRDFENVPEGEHQYKFRLGNGDWWTTDEQAKTVTDEHGNKNNVVVVKSDEASASQTVQRISSAGSLSQAPSLPGSQLDSGLQKANGNATAQKKLEQTQPEKLEEHKGIVPPLQESKPDVPKPSVQPETSTTPSMSEMLKLVEKNPAARLPEDSGKPLPSAAEPKLVEKPAMKVDQGEKTNTSVKEVAKTAAEVADTAAKIDQTPPKKSSDTSSNPATEDVRLSETRKETAPKGAGQDAVNAVAAKNSADTADAPKTPQPKTEDALSSPSVPPAPAVTPVGATPPLTPQKVDQSPSHVTLPLSLTPATPSKSINTISESPPAKLPTVSQQEMAVAAPYPSIPPKTPASSVEDKMKATERANVDSPSVAARVPLPPTPAHDNVVAKADDTIVDKQGADEPPMPGDFSAPSRQNTMADRSAALFDAIKAVPATMHAFFARVITAIVAWLTSVFNSQGSGKAGKSSKSD